MQHSARFRVNALNLKPPNPMNPIFLKFGVLDFRALECLEIWGSGFQGFGVFKGRANSGSALNPASRREGLGSVLPCKL